MNEMGMVAASEDPIIQAMALLMLPLVLCGLFEVGWLWAKGWRE